MKHNKLRYFAFVIATITLLIATAIFFGRNTLLRFAVENVQHKLKLQYSLYLHCSSIHFSQWSGVSAENIVLKDSAGAAIIRVEKLYVEVSPMRMLIGQLRFTNILSENIELYLFDKHNVANYKKFRKSSASNLPNEKEGKGAFIARILKKVTMFSSTEIVLKNTNVVFKDTVGSEQIVLPYFKLHQQKFAAFFTNGKQADTLFAKGFFDAKQALFECKLSHEGDSVGAFSFLKKGYNLNLNFDTIDVEMKWGLAQDAGVHFDVASKVVNFSCAHWRLAAEPIIFPNCRAHVIGMVGSNTFVIDSSSTAAVQDIPLQLFASAFKEDTNYQVALKLKMPEVGADSFFSSLPAGMFHTLKGISCSGRLAYNLHFSVDSRSLDSLVFESDFKRKNFYIRHFGAENFTRINDEFIHDVFIKDRLVRSMSVGHSNAAFTSLRQVAPYLVAAVLQSEDPSFLQHNGFIESAFRESAIQNIKEKRFARGGSTITMQLVKNVFLNRNKNVARKIEEALIVYLIENLHLVSKERLLEVYLNIIEWGPNVYGIGEAAAYYFGKKPAELSLPESVFLAGIIPNPKFYKYQVESGGSFKPHFKRYAEILVNRMLLRERITENDMLSFQPTIVLKGAAAQVVAPAGVEAESVVGEE